MVSAYRQHKPRRIPESTRYPTRRLDDEKNIRTTLTVCLEQLSHQVVSVSSAEGALATLAHEDFLVHNSVLRT